MKFYVYLLYSKVLDVYYKGFTTDVEKRLQYHLSSFHKFTSKSRDWVVVYTAEFDNKAEALKEEIRLKKLNRKSLENLIK